MESKEQHVLTDWSGNGKAVVGNAATNVEFGIGKVTYAFPRNSTTLSLYKSTSNYFLTTYSASTKPLVEAILSRYPIERKGIRNSVLMQLIGDLIYKFGREAAERIVDEHYRRYQPNIGSPLNDHRRDFAVGWDGIRKKIVDSFSREEKQRFDRLTTEHQREGFLIVRAFAGAAEHKKEKDFAISRASLADRLSITPAGATDVILKLREVETIEPTQSPVRQKAPGRFRWLL